MSSSTLRLVRERKLAALLPAEPGGGRIVVLEKRKCLWEPVAVIKLPRDLAFKD